MRRLPVNLATDPVERRRRVRRISRWAALAAVALTVGHALVAVSLTGGQVPVETRPPVGADAVVAAWEAEVARLERAASPQRVRDIVDAVDLGNELIARRAFPWAELFTILERSLPEGARLELVQPIALPEGVRVSLTAASPSRRELVDFLAALERAPELADVYPVRQETGDDGQWRLTVEARHRGVMPGPGGGR